MHKQKLHLKSIEKLQEMHDEPLAANLAYGGGMFGLYRMGEVHPHYTADSSLKGSPCPL